MTYDIVDSLELTNEQMKIILTAVEAGMTVNASTTARAELNKLPPKVLIKLEVVLDIMKLECTGLIYGKV